MPTVLGLGSQKSQRIIVSDGGEGITKKVTVWKVKQW
jgi:hypothetical protein